MIFVLLSTVAALVSAAARLSYRQAAALFEAATRDMPGGPWTLHQLPTRR
jgi:hypothetical protein